MTSLFILYSPQFQPIPTCAHAASPEKEATKAQQILDRWVKRKRLQNLKIGVAMKGLNSSHQAKIDAETLYNPASGTKLLTSAAVMHTWKLDKRFQTRIHGHIVDGRTDNHGLWVVGGGAPQLSAQELEVLAETLTSKGLKHVTGPLHLDLSIFDGNNLPPAYEQKSTTSAYRASIGAFGVDYGAITISIQPVRTSTKPKVLLTSAKGYALLENRARQDDGKKNALKYRLRPMKNGRMKVTIHGTIGRKHPSLTQRLRMLNPNLGAAHILQESLLRRGVKIDSAVDSSGTLPPSLGLLAEHKGATLKELLGGVNTYSNNFMAETIFKHLGKTWPGSQERVTKALESLGLTAGTFKIVNGSGLYRATTISPDAMLKLLVIMAKHPTLGGPFQQTLAVSGQPGTLQRRLNKRLRGAVRGKTGTLNEVVTLSGYLETKTSGGLAFAIFINESTEDRIASVRREIDRLLEQWSRL